MPFLQHEFVPGRLPSGPVQHALIKGQPIDLGDGNIIPGQDQVVSHQPTRPSFISAYIASLPSALAGAMAHANEPYSGFATGFGGGAFGLAQHAQQEKQQERQDAEREHERQQQQFQNQIAQQNLGINKAQLALEQTKAKSINSKLDLAMIIADQDPTKAAEILSQMEQKPRQPVPGTDIPLPPDVEAQRKRIGAANRPIVATPIFPTGASGDAVLKGLSAPEAALVKKMANYEINPQSLSVRGGHRERLLALTSIYDPSYDMTQYSAKASLRKDFTSGGAAKNIRAFNTAIGHLGQLDKAVDALNNNNVQALNKIGNRFSVQVGESGPVSFEAIKNAVTGELATTFKGSGATDQEITHMNSTLSSAQSPKQVHDVVKTYIGLLNSRLNALQEQYNQGMSKPADFNILHPESANVINKIMGKASGGGHIIEIGGKRYQYNGTGATEDMANYTEVQ